MGRPITITTEEWIARAEAVHGSSYCYSHATYEGSNKPITITCPVHGDFLLRASKHIEGVGCRSCNIERQRNRPEDFIARARAVHGDYYNYSLVNYTGLHKPVKIICPVHGEFSQKPVKHIDGQGCKRCKGREVWSTEDFIAKANKVHHGNYSYSHVEYLKSATKVDIHCNICDRDFAQTPNSHLSGAGCPFCGGSKKWSNEEFLEMLADAHDGDIVALEPYMNMDSKISVKHTCGNEWRTTPAKLIHRGDGCPVCSLVASRMTDAEFKERLNVAHGGKIVALEDYVQSKRRLKVRHTTCGREWQAEPRVILRGGCRKCAYDSLKTSPEEFNRRLIEVHRGEIIALEPYSTLRKAVRVKHSCGHEWRADPSLIIRRGTGCPLCASSKGNKRITNLLSDLGVRFETEVRFDSCKHKIALPFDFYLPEYDVLIEYDGKQHFESVSFWGGDTGLEMRKVRDSIKSRWALENEKQLYRIRYDEDLALRLGEILEQVKAVGS